jgi:peptide/nickel transport system substrate-binding protein
VVIQLYNLENEPLNDPRVRQALSLAIDREVILRLIHSNVGAPSNGVVLPVYGFAFDQSRPFPSRDVAEARKLLEAAGHGSGLNINTIAIPGNVARVELLQNMLQEAGITLSNCHVEIPAYRQEFFFDKSVPLAFASFSARADVDGVVRDLWHSSGFWAVPNQPYEKLDSAIDAAAGALDPDERKMLYNTVSDIVNDEARHVTEVFAAYTSITSDKVVGFEPGFDGKGRWRLAGLKG